MSQRTAVQAMALNRRDVLVGSPQVAAAAPVPEWACR